MENPREIHKDYTSTGEFSRLLHTALNNQNSGFTKTPDEQKGLLVNGWLKDYVSGKGITDEKEIDALKQTAATIFSEEKVVLGLGPYVPTEKECQILYEPYTARKSNVGDAIRNIETWREKSFRKALTVRPADRDDLNKHLHNLELQHIREFVGQETGYVKDKAMRVIEGIAVQPLYLLGTNVRERVLAEYIPESPKYDHTPESQTASMVGAVIFYLLLCTLIVKVVKRRLGRHRQFTTTNEIL
ncbi:MAG: hypothetical protein ACYC67_23085 [Prosthecobacter sp.]